MPETMYCSGMPSGSGLPGASHASVQSLRSMRHGLPVNERLRTVSRDAGLDVGVLLHRRVLGLLDHQPLRAGPRALAAERERGRDLRAVADAARGEHRHRRDLLDDLRPQHDRADLAAVAAALAALGDDDVDPGVRVLARLVRRAAQRGDLAARGVDVLDHVRRRGAERVGDERHLRVAQRDLDLRRGGRLGPAEQLQRVVLALAASGTPWSFSSLRAKSRCSCGTMSWSILVRSSVDMSASMPSYLFGITMSTPYGRSPMCSSIQLQLDLELLGAEPDGAEHAEAAGLAHGDDDVAAVGEGEDRELDAEVVTDRGAHGSAAPEGKFGRRAA